MDLKVVNHLSNLPIVKGGINLATNAYSKVKESNRLISWSLGTAEASIYVAFDLSRPTILHFSGPIHLLDEMLDKSLEMIEDIFPIVKSPPQQIVTATKGYMYSVVEPVLKKVDSVKERTIECSDKAAQTLDDALTIADIYVDNYLPEMSKDIVHSSGSGVPLPLTEMDSQTKKTIVHINKFSRTLRRRLSQRAVYEMVQFKHLGINLFHTVLRLVDLLIRDQEMFVRKVREVWYDLSKDEPENQVAPKNLEQLIRLLTKEACRRFVHLTNSMVMHIVNVPKYGEYYLNYSLSQLSQYVQTLNRKEEVALHYIEILKRTMDIIINRFFEIILMELSIRRETIREAVIENTVEINELHEVEEEVNRADDVASSEIGIRDPHHHQYHPNHNHRQDHDHNHSKRGHSKGKHSKNHKTPDRRSRRSHSKDTPPNKPYNAN